MPIDHTRLAVVDDKKRAVAVIGEDKGAGLKRRHTLTIRARINGGGDSLLVPKGEARVYWDDVDEGVIIIEAELVSDRDDMAPALIDLID